MTKWDVFRVPLPNGRFSWCALNSDTRWSDFYFNTHAEAITYATARANITLLVEKQMDKLYGGHRKEEQ